VISADSVQYLTTTGNFDDWVRCLIRYNNTYVAGGNFDNVSGNVANGIAIWDGTTWNHMDHGFTYYPVVYDMAIYTGDLIAAGSFRNATGTGDTLNSIARWDGSYWQPLGNGLTKTNGDGGIG
jgi:hypothetical protein